MAEGDAAARGRWWRWVRGALAIPGLGLPLTLAGLSRQAIPILVSVAVATALGAALGAWRARGPARGAAIAYGAAVIALGLAAHGVARFVGSHGGARIAATALALTALVALDRASGWRARLFRGGGGGFAAALGDVAVVGLGAALVHLGMRGLWTNPAIVSAALLVTPALAFRVPVAALGAWLASATLALYAWHGGMNRATFVGHVDPAPAAGITIEARVHGDPTSPPGARFFRPGRCESTRDAFYMGEAGRTYRLESDGRETVFLDGAESSQTLIERCERGEAIVASFEGAKLIVASLADGRALRELALRAHPATMLIDEARDVLYVSTSLPAGLLEIDLGSLTIVRSLDRYLALDPWCAGVVSLVRVGDRLIGAYSSWFLIDARPGEVFSVDLALGDFRSLGTYRGSWGYLVPDPRDPRTLYLKGVFTETAYRVSPDGGVAPWIELPDGVFYGATLLEPPVLVEGHWNTGELVALCLDRPDRRFTIQTGGMGRMLEAVGRRVYTPSASGYLTVTFPPDLCT